MTTLTERYIQEVVRRVPTDQRDDIADELRATIADTIDGRGGTDAAEHEVLTEMGDPAQLAARYADRPTSLIGPGLYPVYTWLIKILLTIALPIAVLIQVAVDLLDGSGIGPIIATIVTATITVGGQMIAWTTVVFAVLERVMPGIKLGTWTPDQLPELRTPDDKRSDAVALIVWHVLLGGLIVWQATAAPFPTDGGDRIQVLDPALWSGWIWPILAGLTGLVAVGILRLVARRWTPRLVAASVVAEAAFALPLAWILYREEFFNPAFLAEVSVHDGFYTVAVLGVLAMSAYEVVKRVRALRK